MNFGQLYFIIIIVISACLPVHRLPAWVQPEIHVHFIIYGIQKETCGGSLVRKCGGFKGTVQRDF